MTTDSVRISLAPLNDENWVSWSMKMEALLIRKGLWSVVDVQPDASASDPAADLKTKLAARPKSKLEEARSEFLLHVEDSQLAHMRARDPYEIWNALQRVHQSRGFATSLALRRRFLTAKKAPQQSMRAWIGDIQAQAFRMEEAGVAVPDQDKILAATLGLPASYDPVIINFDATPADQLTFEHVVTRLLNEETRQQTSSVAEEPADNSFDAALAVTPARTRSTAPRPVSEITCHFCDEKGHYKVDCPLKKAFELWAKSKFRPSSNTAAVAEEIGDAWSSDEAF